MSDTIRADLVAAIREEVARANNLPWDTTTTDMLTNIADKIAAEPEPQVPVPDDDTIERARKALTTSAVLHDFAGQSDWDETPQHVTCECGEVFEAETVGHAQVLWHEHVIDEQVNVVRPLLASPVPGRSEAEVQWAASIATHNGTPVTAANLRWAATHESLCRSWIFDVLTGLADLLDPAAQVSDTEGTGGP